jgi:hypothetical protein
MTRHDLYLLCLLPFIVVGFLAGYALLGLHAGLLDAYRRGRAAVAAWKAKK